MPTSVILDWDEYQSLLRPSNNLKSWEAFLTHLNEHTEEFEKQRQLMLSADKQSYGALLWLLYTEFINSPAWKP